MELNEFKTVDIKKYETENKLTEAEILSSIFGVYKPYIQSLLDYGFVYNYDKGWFAIKLEINGNTHLVWLQNQIKEDKRVRRYRLSFQQLPNIVLLGSEDFFQYAELHEDYISLNVNGIFNYIKIVYDLNQVKEKDTFKKFVENEKEIEELDGKKPIPPASTHFTTM